MITGMRSFLRIFRLVVNQLTFPVMVFHERESYLSFSAVMYKTKLCYYRDVRYTVMILFYNLSAGVCD